MNILVTGANGFIGSNICSFLEKNTNYKIFKGTRNSIDLYSYNNVSEYIKTNNIDSIIHCAIEGGKRTSKDPESIFYNNILISQNLIMCPIKGSFINIASGAEFDRSQDIFNVNEDEIYKRIPTDYYGLSKNIISKLVNQMSNGINLRIFGCFNYNEDLNRMIRSNINKYIKHEPMIIHQDKYMDFIYIKDLFELINFILKNYNQHFKKLDINVVYKEKYKLSDITTIINNLDTHKVPIIIENKQSGMNYCGNGCQYFNFNLNCIGIKNGLIECYNNLI